MSDSSLKPIIELNETSLKQNNDTTSSLLHYYCGFFLETSSLDISYHGVSQL